MKMNVKGNDNFRTPDKLFKQLNDIFAFTIDAACTKEDCKCQKGFYHDEGVNALEMPWGGSVSFAIRRLVKRPLLLKRLITKSLTAIVLSALWCCRPTAKTAKLFNNLLKRISFMKQFPAALPLLIRKPANR